MPARGGERDDVHGAGEAREHAAVEGGAVADDGKIGVRQAIEVAAREGAEQHHGLNAGQVAHRARRRRSGRR
jgi:hypothetical protein